MPIDVTAFDAARVPGAEALEARPLFSIPANNAPLGTSYTSVCQVEIVGTPYILAYDKANGDARFYRVADADPWLVPTATANLTPGWDIVQSFVIGNQPYLMCYETKTGWFGFFPLSTALDVAAPYRFRRTHEPGTSNGFTMVKSFVAAGGVAFIGYNGATGAVAMYTISVTATSPEHLPPLFALAVWSHQWAKGWTRFAFFQFGAENFFLKTNTVFPNVNIDHIVDGLVGGTLEVSTNMNLVEAQALTIVEPMRYNRGDNYVIAYKPDGVVALYRIWPDCSGWTEAARFQGPAAIDHIVGIPRGERNVLVFC
jgi:hypothetical protein